MNQILMLIFINLVFLVNKGQMLQCYKCVSVNGNDLDCQLGRKTVPYHTPCHIGSSDKPGNRCIKIEGTVVTNQGGYERRNSVLIRDCTDRTYYKGEPIEYEQHVINGRAFTCKSNLCNNSNRILNRFDFIKIIIFVCLTVFSIQKLV